MPSSRLSDYELGEVVGVGTVGTIYCATERSSGLRVAIKKLHPGVSQDPLIRARFKREMTILERLRHPNIIAYYGGGEDGGQLHYVMELVEGGTVKDLLSEGGLAWMAVVEIARQVCSALQFAHNHGVIHRDLKPGNLFLTRSADVKLGDFGIARDLTIGDLTDAGLTVGTHAYMAPEQITGDDLISGKADLYALGCCLFEMLTGRKPFLGDNFAQLFDQHLRAEPPHVQQFVADCPDELDAIIHQLLAKNPEQRPFNARKVQAVMLKLDEQPSSGDDRATGDRRPTDRGAPSAVSRDVAADRVTEVGRRLLEQQIAGRESSNAAAEVSWTKLAVLVAVVIALIAAASVLAE